MWIVPITLILIILCLALGYLTGYQEGYLNGQIDEFIKSESSKETLNE